MSEAADVYHATQQCFTVKHNANNDDASPKLCPDSVTSNNDDILTTLVQNQQLMLDAMHRLESTLNIVQHDFNTRLTTLENQTGSVLTFATETHEMTRQLQKAFDATETGLGNFIAANDSYSNPVTSSPGNNVINENSLCTETVDPSSPGNNVINENLLCTETVDHCWDQEATITDSVVPVSDIATEECCSFLSSSQDPASYQPREELQQQMNMSFSLSTTQTISSSSKPASRRRGIHRPGAKLQLDPNDPTVGWIGGNPNLPILISQYSQILSKSGSTAMQLLFALLVHVVGGRGNLRHLSWAGRNGRPPLKDDPAFASCVAQASLQFPTFQMSPSIGQKVADRLGKLRKRHVSPSSRAAKKKSCSFSASPRFNVDNKCSFQGIPTATDCGEVSMGAQDLVVMVKSEIEDHWDPQYSQ